MTSTSQSATAALSNERPAERRMALHYLRERASPFSAARGRGGIFHESSRERIEGVTWLATVDSCVRACALTGRAHCLGTDLILKALKGITIRPSIINSARTFELSGHNFALVNSKFLPPRSVHASSSPYSIARHELIKTLSSVRPSVFEAWSKRSQHQLPSIHP